MKESEKEIDRENRRDTENERDTENDIRRRERDNER